MLLRIDFAKHQKSHQYQKKAYFNILFFKTSFFKNNVKVTPHPFKGNPPCFDIPLWSCFKIFYSFNQTLSLCIEILLVCNLIANFADSRNILNIFYILFKKESYSHYLNTNWCCSSVTYLKTKTGFPGSGLQENRVNNILLRYSLL